jgi:hypothetical protein
MTREQLLELQSIAKTQLEAARSGDLGAVADCERARRALIDAAEPDELQHLGEREPERLRKALALVAECERRVKTCLLAGLAQRRGSLAALDRRRGAERAYRGMEKRGA